MLRFYAGARGRVIGLASLAVLALAAPASANIVTVTYTGTVSSGLDQTGVFGPANTDLTGDGFTAVFKFDTTKGQVYASPIHNLVQGGVAYGVPSPSLGATIAINGVTWNLTGDFIGVISGYNDGSISNQGHEAGDEGHIGSFFFSDEVTAGATGHPGNLPASIDMPMNLNLGSDSQAGGEFNIENGVHLSGGTNQMIDYAYGALNPVSLTETVAPAPEPSTWVELMLGLASIGWLARRRARALEVGSVGAS